MNRRLPPARVVTGVDSASSFQFVSRLRSAGRSLRPPVREALAVMVGVWPLWVMAAAGAGLIWFIGVSAGAP